VEVIEVPSPRLLPGCVLVRVAASLISAGTERASTEFSRKNLLQKAKARPDLVQEVVAKIHRDGLVSAFSTVRSRLDQATALGYSSSGTVVAIGEGVRDIVIGDRVACAGAGFAIHAEFASVPRLLVAPIRSDSISFEEAAFTTLGAVALHGVRIAEVKLGDVVAVIGLGLVGQLAVQLLKAAGCQVLGMDINPERAQLAQTLGADAVSSDASDFDALCRVSSRDYGVDAVLITAETASSTPANLAAKVARDRGIVVAVGTVGMELERKIFYEKELDFRVSRSYGPGRYDTAYEQKGRDYPIGYVRWTETRNMEAFLQLLAGRKLDVQSLITHRFPIERARAAYDLISGKVSQSFLGVLITYAEGAELQSRLTLVGKTLTPNVRQHGRVGIGVLGAGAFAANTLLPALKRTGKVDLIGISAATGTHARHAADKFGFRYCATDEEEILRDPEVDTVVIATRHHLHAEQVIRALRSGKHVFCEKPLCLNDAELHEIIRAHREQCRPLALMVGFNRRFAPMAMKMKSFLADVHEPLVMHYRVNAGFIEPDHWTNDPEQGGGRILGEVCHFIDLMVFLAGTTLIEVRTEAITNLGRYSADNIIVSLRFSNGSHGTLTYMANGDRAYSKERLEVFGGGCVAMLDDFRSLELVRHGRKRITRSRLRQDKGHRTGLQAFVDAIHNGGEPPIPFSDILTVSLATFAAAESFRTGLPVSVNADSFLSSKTF
jgi:predicted dehydrogenase